MGETDEKVALGEGVERPTLSAPIDDDEQISAALQALRTLMIERIKLEQRRDQLTGLPNDRALEELLQQHLTEQRDFWVAFVEVDRFKSVNDAFGYQNADLLLRRVARVLQQMSGHFAGEKTQAFRPHGDEFFLVGSHGDSNEHRVDVLERLLDLVRTKLRDLRVPVVSTPKGAPTQMRCTVSVGWLVLADVAEPVTTRSIRDCLERAMDEAKRTRDHAVRYSTELRRRRFISLRADCTACGTKFNVDTPVDVDAAIDSANSQTPFRCPHCHEEVPRPPPPADLLGHPPVEI